jgi:hypothetical protein
MRRLLGLSLAIALGLTAVVAAPIAAGSSNDDCTVVMTSQGRTCLSDRDLRLFDRRDEISDRDLRLFDRRDEISDRDLRSMVSCGCLSVREQRRLEQILDDPDRTTVGRVVRILAAQDCFSDSDLQRLRRGAVRLDRDDLEKLVEYGGACERTTNRLFGRFGWRALLQDRELWRRNDTGCVTDTDIRRLDRRATDLDMWDIRDILGYSDRRDCVTARDVRRLDRNTDDLDLMDIMWFLGGRDLR